jgi:dihydrodipicolinate reductase
MQDIQNKNKNTVISVVGTGKMGLAVIDQLTNLGYTINAYNSKNPINVHKLFQTNSQIVIDCSIPSVVLSNMQIAIEAKNHLVVATTGWYEHYDEIQNQVVKNNLRAIASTNFDKMAIVYRILNQITSSTLSSNSNLRVGILESHDATKKDVSGTAVSIVNEDILQYLTAQTEVVYGIPNGPILDHQLQVISERKHGKNPPTHIIDYTDQSNGTTVSLIHKGDANRQNYAQGIVDSVQILLSSNFVGIKDYAKDIVKPQIISQIQTLF